MSGWRLSLEHPEPASLRVVLTALADPRYAIVRHAPAAKRLFIDGSDSQFGFHTPNRTSGGTAITRLRNVTAAMADVHPRMMRWWDINGLCLVAERDEGSAALRIVDVLQVPGYLRTSHLPYAERHAIVGGLIAELADACAMGQLPWAQTDMLTEEARDTFAERLEAGDPESLAALASRGFTLRDLTAPYGQPGAWLLPSRVRGPAGADHF